MKLNKQEKAALKKLLKDNQYSDNSSLGQLYKKLSKSSDITLYIDGASDLHSKTAGIGGVIYNSDEEVYSFSEYLDDATNNEAEYRALIKGLQASLKKYKI